ncbi:MAG TPA: class I SAM-dependent methyltransferase [Chitinophagaceae bacterium]|nr:class I SAM-dependent methyltransferase [Chitinophagaceae bacterium]
MSSQIHYILCPVCGSAGISKVFNVKDNTVSQEYFEIYHCSNCQARFTQHPPAASGIGQYYKSEDYISHTDTSKGLINRLYRLVRNYSLNQKRKLIEKATGLRRGSLLDVGSGTGHFAAAMQKEGWQVTGLEPDDGAREMAMKRHSIKLLPDTELFNLPPNRFNAITLWHVLEHVHELKKYILSFKGLLADNGKLFIAVPNYTSYDAKVYQEYWAGYDVPRHLYHFTPPTMQWLMKELGLKVIEVKPMWFDSFYVSLLSSKYKNGNTKWFEAFWTGLVSNFKAMNDVKKCSSVIYIIGK